MAFLGTRISGKVARQWLFNATNAKSSKNSETHQTPLYVYGLHMEAWRHDKHRPKLGGKISGKGRREGLWNGPDRNGETCADLIIRVRIAESSTPLQQVFCHNMSLNGPQASVFSFEGYSGRPKEPKGRPKRGGSGVKPRTALKNMSVFC